MDDRIKRIADHYGYETQSRQLIEEMAELTQVINKEWRFANGFLPEVDYMALADNIAEEITDTEIMIEQVKYLLGIENKVKDWREKKLERTLEKVEPEKMITVIEGVHDISIDPAAKEYMWRVPEGLTVKAGDIVRVNTKFGQDNALVLKVVDIPESEAEKHKAVVGVVSLEAGLW